MTTRVKSVYCHTLNKWDYGYTLYEDGSKLPWIKLNSTHHKIKVWKNNKWCDSTIHSSNYRTKYE